MVTHDDVWCSVLGNVCYPLLLSYQNNPLYQEDTELPNDEELLRRINCEYRVATYASKPYRPLLFYKLILHLDGAFLLSSADHENVESYLNASTFFPFSDDDHMSLEPESSQNDFWKDYCTGTCGLSILKIKSLTLTRINGSWLGAVRSARCSPQLRKRPDGRPTSRSSVSPHHKRYGSFDSLRILIPGTPNIPYFHLRKVGNLIQFTDTTCSS